MSIAPFQRAAGPTGYPLVGVFPRARRDPLGFFLECSRRYGDVLAMRLGRQQVYLLSHPAHVKHVLQDHARAYAKGPAATRVRGLFGDSLTVVDGHRWRQRRRQLQPAFHPGQGARLASVVTVATEEMLERWRSLAEESRPIDAVTEMRRLTQTIIIRACLGSMSAPDEEALRGAMGAAVERVERRLWSPWGWLDVPAPPGARHRRALAAIGAAVGGAMDRARRAAPPPGTMLAALLADAEEPLAEDEIRSELRAMLFAGHTTTASALAWVWHVLAAHPTAWERLDGDYTRRVIEEVLRLYPPTWLTARMLVDEDTLGGYAAKPCALVLLCPYLTHRHPAVWQDPERFDPDRFEPGRAAARPAFAYFPFGGGPRRCIGSGFASSEMRMIVEAVARRYRLALPPGTVLPFAGLTLRPGRPMPARLERRG